MIGRWCQYVRVFDIMDKQSEYRSADVLGCYSFSEAIEDASTVLSLVTADQSVLVAKKAASIIAPDTYYFDMNSVAPHTKRMAADHIENAGGHYVDVAIMAPVNPAHLSVPLLLSGAFAEKGMAILEDLGFDNISLVPGEIGKASSVKMIRSIMVKGVEALTAEMMMAAEKAGVTDEVLHSLGDGWSDKAQYNIERMTTHGQRRAAEMEEVALTLGMLDIQPLMTRGTIAWQREMAKKDI